MKLTCLAEENTVALTVDALAAFARKKPGADTGFSPAAEDLDAVLSHGVSLSVTRPVGGYTAVFSGEADTVGVYRGYPALVLRRPVRRRPASVRVGDDPFFLAAVMCTAYLLAERESAERIAAFITYTSERGEEDASHLGVFPREYLARLFSVLVERAAPFIALQAYRRIEGRAALSRLRFPYRSIREGQRECIDEVYRCIRTKRRLLAGAPTGIGKTMSVLYPSLRAVGAGLADTVFYLTAKTVTGNVALDTVRLLSEQAPGLRCIRLAAKERMCPIKRSDPGARPSCFHCPYMHIYEDEPYEKRRDDALAALFLSGNIYDSADIARVAEAHHVCPYELSLDASEYCEVIVCDYGYLFDPRVRLRRYFAEEREESYIFLIDEAHNLPDRAREIYSASLSSEQLAAYRETVLTALPDDTRLAEAFDELDATLASVRALCRENSENTGEGQTGYYLSRELPPAALSAGAHLRVLCEEYLRKSYETAAPLFEDVRATLRALSDAAAAFDEKFLFYAETADGKTSLRVLCMDPSGILDTAMARAEATVLFSATLSPMEYYADVLGSPDAVRLELASPYDPENLCLVTVDSVSTRYSGRSGTADDVAELIETVTAAREGNYIVYFPSYAYMTSVCRRFLAISGGARVIMQKPGMSIRERDRFLAEFSRSARSGEGVIAFCVLGGIFSEGIDLRGERLIGTVIVGLGLPGLSSELNVLADYYERVRENGRDYAYTYPAINKILQAAGRVIRGEEDRGVVVLIDDRYADPHLRRLFPPSWERMLYTGDSYSLSTILERFWAKWDDI